MKIFEMAVDAVNFIVYTGLYCFLLFLMLGFTADHNLEGQAVMLGIFLLALYARAAFNGAETARTLYFDALTAQKREVWEKLEV